MAEALVSLVIAESSVVCCRLDLALDTVFREWWPLVAQGSNSSYLVLEVHRSSKSVSQNCRWILGSPSSRICGSHVLESFSGGS